MGEAMPDFKMVKNRIPVGVIGTFDVKIPPQVAGSFDNTLPVDVLPRQLLGNLRLTIE